MRRLTKILIALPVMMLPMVANPANRPAVAAEIAAEQAAAVLKRAETVDARCNFLTPAMHDELSDYAARAELAAATQVSAEAARNAVAQGKAQATTAQCDEATAAEITAILFAAREAVSITGSAKQENVAAASPPESKAKQGAAKPTDHRAKPVEIPPKAGRGSLSRYAKLVGSYYIERKCRHLSPDQDFRYWKSIGRIHRSTVAASGTAAVAAVMRQAEYHARGVPCGYRSLYLVKSGFAKTVRR